MGDTVFFTVDWLLQEFVPIKSLKLLKLALTNLIDGITFQALHFLCTYKHILRTVFQMDV